MAIPSQSFALPNENNTYQNRYLYNGKEYQDDFGLNWYDYGARFYDPQIARWHSVDPIIERLKYASPYAYALNNPIRMIDLIGLFPFDPNKLREAINLAYSNTDISSLTCNTAVQDVMVTLIGYKVPGQANDMIDHMDEDTGNWEKIIVNNESDFINLQEKANKGYLIIGAKKGTVHGHVNVLRPGRGARAGKWGQLFKSDKSALFVPESLEANQTSNKQSINWGWGSDVDPFSLVFYKYIGNQDNRIYLPKKDLEEFIFTADAPQRKERKYPITLSLPSSVFQSGRKNPGEFGYIGSYWETYDSARKFGKE
jgi:RHS repeat-associated protein